MKLTINTKRTLSWVLFGLWAAFLGVCSLLRAAPAAEALDWAVRLFQALYGAVAGNYTAEVGELVRQYRPWLLQVLGYMLLALLAWNGLRLHLGRNSSLALALAVTCLVSVLNELSQMFVPGRIPRLTDWSLDMAGAFVLLAGIWVFQFLWFRFPHLVNRETVSYVVFGVLTTVVNIVAFQVCFNTFPMTPVLRNTVSNTIAWILAVVFADVVNKLFVFQSKTTGFKELLWEAGKFVGARLLSYVVDMAGMLLLVNLLHVNSGLSKIGMNVIVMIMNYFFSKWFIFKEADAAPVDREEKTP